MRRRDFLKGLAAVVGCGVVGGTTVKAAPVLERFSSGRWDGIGHIDRIIYEMVEYHVAETILNHGEWEMDRAYVHLPMEVYEACIRAGKGGTHIASTAMVINEAFQWGKDSFDIAVFQVDARGRTLAHRYINVPLGHPHKGGMRLNGFRSAFCDDEDLFLRFAKYLA